jgi:hypothetical protein
MSNETRYVATETDVDIVLRGREEWRKSATRPAIVGDLTWENVASLMNEAYQRGRTEQREDIRKVLGVR